MFEVAVESIENVETENHVESEVITNVSGGWVVRKVATDWDLQSCPKCEELLLGLPQQDHNYCGSANPMFHQFMASNTSHMSA